MKKTLNIVWKIVLVLIIAFLLVGSGVIYTKRDKIVTSKITMKYFAQVVNENNEEAIKNFVANSNNDVLYDNFVKTLDNNYYFDQDKGISTSGLIDHSHIKAIAGIEIPWFGCIKLYLNDKNISKIPDNSLPCLIVAIIDVIFFFLMIMTITNCYYIWKKERNKG